MKSVFFIIGIFLLWRVLLFVPLLYGNEKIPLQKSSVQYTLWAYTRPYPPVGSFLWYPWANFDGVHYLTIAGNGTYANASDGRFFPFYPILIRTALLLLGNGPIFGIKEFFSGIGVANAAFLLSLVMLYKLILLDYSKKIAFTTILLLLCFPTAFFFGGVYSESLFLFLSVSIFYFLRKRFFKLATIFSFFLVMTRVVGVCIIPIVWYYLWKDDMKGILSGKRNIPFSQLASRIFFSLLIPSGFIGFALYNWHNWSDPFFFIHAQQHVVIGRSSTLVLFPQTMFRYIKILLTVSHVQFEWWISLLEFSSFLFAATLLVYGLKKGIHTSYLLFSTLCFLIPTQSGTFSGLSRYVMILFPIFLALALSKNTFLKILYVGIGLLSLFFLLAFFSRGYFIS